MRATVDAKAFSEALNHVGKVPRQSTIPVLAGVLVRFENRRCSITGTDLTTWLTMALPASGEDFAFLLDDPSKASKACRFFDGEMTLELHGEDPKYPVATLTCGHRSGTFDAFLEKEYSEWPKSEEGVSFTANAAALLKRIEKVKYAVRVPQGFIERAQQTCVQFSGNDVFTLDGYRAACDTDTALTFPKPFLTWGDSLSLLKLMGDSEVTVQVGTNHVWFSSDTVTIVCRREGVETFPLQDAVPKKFSEEFTVSPGEFLRELDYLQGFQPKKNRLTTVFCGGRLFLDKAETKCSTSVEIEGESKLAVGFDQRYMKDALTQFKGEPCVRMKLTSGIGPIIIEAEGRNDFAMVLPVRLHGLMAA